MMCNLCKTIVYYYYELKDFLCSENATACQLCNTQRALTVLECSHVLCSNCKNTQKYYTKKPCFICHLEDKCLTKGYFAIQ